jgi:hypothetical protein
MTAASEEIMKPLNKLFFIIPLLAGVSLYAQNNTVVLKRAFVEKYKDRATIDTKFFVDHAHKRPNPPSKDGDMHVAGRAQNEVGLPMVAEVMNAAQKGQSTVVTEIHEIEGNNSAVQVTGAWRFWFEHPAKKQVQFGKVPVPGNTNPAHSFEIHPVTKFDKNGIVTSFQNVPGFEPYDAEKAFSYYEKLKVTVTASSSAVSISAAKAQYNYAEFKMTLVGSPKKLADGGYAALASVDGTAEESIASNIRMIFVPDTPPLQALVGKQLGDGDKMHVIGIPRINLNAISSMVAASGSQPVTRKLPYEMIIVAVFK